MYSGKKFVFKFSNGKDLTIDGDAVRSYEWDNEYILFLPKDDENVNWDKFYIPFYNVLYYYVQ